MVRWASAAMSGVAVLPVPMAQTGSYAITILANCSSLRPAIPFWNWLASKASVPPLSRSSRRSPTHTMGETPNSSAACVRLSTVSSVSPKYWRRSLWPMRVWVTPTAFSMGPEISPVKAPSLAHPIFCAPMRMWLPLTASTAAGRFVKGGQITISQCSDFSTSGRNFSKNAMVSAGVLYIFQLPDMTGFLIRFPIKSWCLVKCVPRNFRPRLANIGECSAHPEVHARPRLRARRQQRDVLPAMVGGWRRRVATVVGGEDGQIVRTQGALEFRHPGVELLERVAVAFDIVAVAELLVEIDQIHVDQPGILGLHGFERLRHAFGVVRGLGGFADTPAQEDIENLADTVDEDAAVVELIEQHALGRRHGVIMAIGGAREITGRADERPRNHAADFVRAAQDFARGFAHLVKFPKRDHLFVRGDLEDAIGGRVDNGRPRAHVVGAQLLDDLGAGSRPVTQRTAAGPPLELAYDLGRKTVRKKREWFGEMDAHHFPMAGSGVLTRRGQRAFSVCGRGLRNRREAGERLDVAQAQARQVGQPDAANARDVP